MSKELDFLESMKDCLTPNGDIFEHTKEYKDIRKALLESQEQEKVIEIIKRVYTDLCFILSYDTFEEYDRTCDLISVQANLKRVNKEEFNLLKRYFKYENRN